MKNQKIFIYALLASCLLHLTLLKVFSNSSEWSPAVTTSISALNINVQSPAAMIHSSKTSSKQIRSKNHRAQSGVTQKSLPTLLDALAPEYPWRSRINEEQGEVVASVRVNDEGKAFEINVIKSSGFSRLDESAVNAIKLASFSKGAGGQKIELTLNFELRDKK